ncbi:hypothetical protein [Parashewanella tropica]|uniref:hypothetical protein n=1 Tax=Parashewanella tropica TaxID=2547970 RepID=UPI001059F65D|nr:hypothetical protein [Parashewanella tropica]
MSVGGNYSSKVSELVTQIKQDSDPKLRPQSEWSLNYTSSKGVEVKKSFKVSQSDTGQYRVDDKNTGYVARFLAFFFGRRSTEAQDVEVSLNLQRYQATVIPNQNAYEADFDAGLNNIASRMEGFLSNIVGRQYMEAAPTRTPVQVAGAQPGEQFVLSPKLQGFRQWAIQHQVQFNDGIADQLSHQPNLSHLGKADDIRHLLLSAVDTRPKVLSPAEVTCLDAAHKLIQHEGQQANGIRNWARAVNLEVDIALANKISLDVRARNIGVPGYIKQELNDVIRGNAPLMYHQVALLNACSRTYASEVSNGNKIDGHKLYVAKDFVRKIKHDGYKMTEDNFEKIAQSKGVKGRWDLGYVKHLVNSALEHPDRPFTTEQVQCLKVAQDVVNQHLSQFRADL